VICPNCGEENSPAFRFCGMCGTPLDARNPAAAATITEPAQNSRPAYSPPGSSPKIRPAEPSAQARMHPAMGEPSDTTMPGPSLLGLRSDSAGESRAPSYASRASLSSRSTLLEPEERGSGMGRTLLLLVVLAAACGGAWWAYKNYRGTSSQTQSTAPDDAKPSASTAGSAGSAASTQAPVSPQTTPSDQKTSSAAQPTTPATQQTTIQSATPASTGQPENVPPAAATSTTPTEPKQIAPKPETTSASPPPTNTKPPAHAPRPQQPASKPAIETASKPAMEVHASRSAPAHVEKPTAAVGPNTADKGDGDYRKGEAYLYGRGAAEDCDNAVKYLKSSSAQQNAKARSTFGTMYATGHCVPRDLPTSYRWFALALQADPNNQILEKDLTAVWNQLTPPERQAAARAKQ
jgi:TPR repeat protein